VSRRSPYRELGPKVVSLSCLAFSTIEDLWLVLPIPGPNQLDPGKFGGRAIPKPPPRFPLSYAFLHPAKRRDADSHNNVCTFYLPCTHNTGQVPLSSLPVNGPLRGEDCSGWYSSPVPPQAKSPSARTALFESLPGSTNSFSTVNTMPRHTITHESVRTWHIYEALSCIDYDYISWSHYIVDRCKASITPQRGLSR